MKPVYIVHCIDTEGPLYETLEATFERLKHIFHINLPATSENLAKLQKGIYDTPHKEAIKKVVQPHLINYHSDWKSIKQMFDQLTSEDFRTSMLDSYNNGWIYNWFCVDHINYDNNPRERTCGYHAIFDRYHKFYGDSTGKDLIQFHYHPHPFNKNAHHCATQWLYTNKLHQILSRRIIDRLWFPAVTRPGFQVTRPDSHWFLEQYIPFDYASLAKEPEQVDIQQFDFSHGRSGDWRRAPRNWKPYHPSHDDYQTEGSSNRWITRCLNIGTRSYLLNQELVNDAFKQASNTRPTILSFTDHDFRDIKTDILSVQEMIHKAKETYNIHYKFTDAITAMRESLSLHKLKPPTLRLGVQRIRPDVHVLHVSSESETFGPQPYFCFKTHSGQYFHDNLDFQEPRKRWSYVFDSETFPLRAIEKIGVATNNAYGTTSVCVYDTEKATSIGKLYNIGE